MAKKCTVRLILTYRDVTFTQKFIKKVKEGVAECLEDYEYDISESVEGDRIIFLQTSDTEGWAEYWSDSVKAQQLEGDLRICLKGDYLPYRIDVELLCNG